MSTNYTLLIQQARTETKDMVYHNNRIRQPLIGERDAVNTIFYLSERNIVTGIVNTVEYGPWLTYGATKRQAADATSPIFTFDAVNSILTMNTAPDTGTTQPFFVDYYFQYFVDADYNTWIDQATEELGFLAGTDCGNNLYPALTKYVASYFWLARASQYADKFASSGGGQAEQIQTVTSNFARLAAIARKEGDALRKNAYVDPGGLIQPASATITTIPTRYAPVE